jgi:hypothetical protein
MARVDPDVPVVRVAGPDGPVEIAVDTRTDLAA